MPSIYFAYDKVEFTCDISNMIGTFEDMHLAWYDVRTRGETQITERCQNFMIVAKGHGFENLPNQKVFEDLEYTLSDVPLKALFEKRGGAMSLLCQILNPLTVYPNSIKSHDIDLDSFTEVLRRLTIWGYEPVKDYFSDFIKFEEFSGFTEEQMLETDNLIKLRKLVENSI
jgi:hypothetical protein